MQLNKLKKIIKKIFINKGLSVDHSTKCMNAIINAELVGASSHGLSRIKMYCDRIDKKLINNKPKIKIKKYLILLLLLMLTILLDLLELSLELIMQLKMLKKVV